ncbi:hypothetical protein NECAME_12318 [Necator americanus]|uniref:Uncharacterized protein n=1 Tax=Necator americanus TaxID=51031 RepID=W2T2P7_NECAM|nr:hypothetical protein NECAME_12318 [Necator americanus]ETN75516.1 hypothetical protein NECAME_12318 [Necator americanus]
MSVDLRVCMCGRVRRRAIEWSRRPTGVEVSWTPAGTHTSHDLGFEEVCTLHRSRISTEARRNI